MSEVEQAEIEVEERIAAARAAEQDFVDRLQTDAQRALWDRCKDGLHAERFWESRTGLRVANTLIAEILSAQIDWLNATNPTSPEIVDAHRRAQAAEAALYAIDKAIGDGKQAAQELEQLNREIDGE